MKKILNRFITMLILITMALEVILPISVYASNETTFIPEETTWYRVSHMSGKDNNTEIAKDLEFYKQIYYIESGERKTPTISTEGSKAKVYLVVGKTYYVPKLDNWNGDRFHKVINEDSTFGDNLKSMVAMFFYGIGSGLHFLIGAALGQTITIDDLVFNNYGETNISYFDTKEEVGENASSLIYGNNEVGGLNTVVNEWYKIFMSIAIMGYMIMLVYMGIRILLTATADSKASYKEFFLNWIIGIAILLLLPYAMKYIININEALVETIEANKGFESTSTSALENIDYDKKFTAISIEDEIDWSQGTDYMSKIAYATKVTKEPALAFGFIIMTWQLLVLVFHYYKRLFMIAFLIIIFPLVALSYAIDKIADGKSQALNTWLKEFILNVFVQTFHAIVYVFVCTTVYSAAGLNGSAIGFDFILIIVGITFLFKGEEIIRQIFGQVSKAGTMGSLQDSAAMTFAKFKLAEGFVKKTVDYTVGNKSIGRKVARGVNQIRALSARENAFDATAEKQQSYNPGMRLEHAPSMPDKDASEQEKKNFLKEREYYNAAAMLNNPNSYSLAEKANALNILKDLHDKNPEHDVFKDTKMTIGQIAAMSKLDKDVQGMLASGMKRVDIERNISIRMGVVFAGESKESIVDRTSTYYTALYLNGSTTTVSRSGIARNVRETIDAINKEEAEIKYGNNRKYSRQDLEKMANDISKDYLDEFDDSLSDDEKNNLKEMAKDIAIINRRKNGEFTSQELLKTIENLKEHAYDNEAVQKMINECVDSELDIDSLAHIMAKKDVDNPIVDTNSEHYKLAKRIVNDYENNTRDGYFIDEISIHELIRDKHDQSKIDAIIEESYKNQKDAMQEATENFAEDYLVDHKVDFMKNYHDTSVELQNGKTREEIAAMKVDALFQTLSNIAAINKDSVEDGGAVGYSAMKIDEYLSKKEAERTGISDYDPIKRQGAIKSMKEFEKRLHITGKDYIDKRKSEREKIARQHFLGDIDK